MWKLFSSLRRGFRRSRPVRRWKPQTRVLRAEPLEERRVLATVTLSPGGDTAEGTGPGYITVSLDQSLPEPLTVYFTISGSAIEGADYVDIGESVVIPAETILVDIPIDSVIDNEFEPSETVTLTLDTDSNYTIGAQGSATIEIHHCNGYVAGPVDVPQTCTDCALLSGPMDAVNAASNPASETGPVMSDTAAGGVHPFWSNAAPFSGNTGGVAFSFSPSGFSSHPVRYADGVVMVSSRDLESEGMGVPWGVTRSWTNAQAHYQQNVVGTRMIVSEQPYIRSTDAPTSTTPARRPTSMSIFPSIISPTAPRPRSGPRGPTSTAPSSPTTPAAASIAPSSPMEQSCAPFSTDSGGR